MDIFGSLGGMVNAAGGYILPFLFVLVIVIFVHEFGHFIVGHDRLGIGVVSNQSGLVVQSSKVAARVSRTPDGWSERVDLDVDGVAWEILQPEPLRILPTGHTPNRQQEGMVRRVGETRKPVRWQAWGETAHGTERQFRFDRLYRPLTDPVR